MTRNHTIAYDSSTLHTIETYNRYCQLYFWTGLLILFLVAALAHLVSVLHGLRRRALAGDYRARGEKVPKGCSRTGKRCTRWLPSSALAVWRKTTCRKSPIPTLGSWSQVLLILVYVALNVGIVFGGGEGNISWHAHHAARLAMANLPLVITLASKNNIISYITGYSYESLNVLHRWSARMFFALSIIHIIGRIYVNDPSTSFGGRGRAYLVWGLLAFLALCFLVVSATRQFRNRFYSLFIVSHVGLLFILLAGLWVHRPQQSPWIIVSIASYTIDRLWRTARIVYWHAYPRAIEGSAALPLAWCEVLAPDTIRVTVRTRMSWIPGQHGYLHVPKVSPGGHPFTISTICDSLEDDPAIEAVSAPKLSEQTPGTLALLWRQRRRWSLQHEARVEMLIRVRDGVTRRLFDLAMSASKLSGEPCSIDAWCEGAYGNLQYLGAEYQSVLLVAGGTGVTFCLPLMLDVVRRAHRMDLGYTDNPVACERLTFCWVIRDIAQLEWLRPHLDQVISIAPPGLLHIKLFITSPTSSLSTSLAPEATLPLEAGVMTELSSRRPSIANSWHVDNQDFVDALEVPPVDSSPPSPSPPPNVEFTIRRGRPDLATLLADEIEVTEYSDWLAVAVCGPSALGAGLAAEVSKAIKPSAVFRGEHRRNIYFHEEVFGW